MSGLEYMNGFPKGGIFLSSTLLFSLIVVLTLPNVYADEVVIKNISLEETTILELANETNEEISTFRVWLAKDFEFKSFKTEKGWIGEKTPQGVIIFTSSETIKPGESVKFGFKTDKISTGINWKALDENNKQIDTGKALPGELPSIIENSSNNEKQIEKTNQGISSDSTFRIVPEKPNAGSSFRVTGDNFGTLEKFDFYINSKKIGSFETDENGHFMTTMKIPENQKAERVDFKIKDGVGEEKKMSLRIGEVQNRIPASDNIKLTIKGLPNVIHRGDLLEISGTGDPGSAITAEITTPEGEIINSRTAEVNSIGNWELEEPVLIALDAPFGKYSATITDGRETILKQWSVESDKTIIIAPSSLKFEVGETMTFSGIAIANQPIEILLEDPLGKEIFSDILQVDKDGSVDFEYDTEQTATKGTYTIVATQGKEKEFIFVGLGQLPTIPVNLEFDKLNYKTSETAIVSLSGTASEIVSLLIIDPSDKPKGDAISITLQPDGTGTYELDLKGFSSGVYTAVVSKGTAQSTEIFTVGLQIGSGDIKINTTKEDYHPGDSILILGDTNPNVLLTITMIDPNGDEIKIKETFSDKNGKISEDAFRIPSDGKAGTYTIKAKSGSNFFNTEINVLAVEQEGMVVSIEEGESYGGVGKTMNIQVFGGAQTVTIEIIAEDGEIIAELEFPASNEGEINQPWIIPKDTEPGTYTIKAKDAFNSAEAIFEIK